MAEVQGVHPPFIIRNSSYSPYDLAPFITSSTFTASTDAVTEIQTVIEDTDLRRLRSGIFNLHSTIVDWEGIHKMSLAAIEANPGNSGRGGLRLDWRSRYIRNLKSRRGAHVLRGVSASQYVQSECKAIGLTFVYAQDTSRRTQIARDVPAADSPPEEGANYPSAWTTFQRLAREEGFIVFEYGGSLYFGRPSWIRARRKEQNFAGWQMWPNDQERTLAHPTCRRSADARALVEVEVQYPWSNRHNFRPGWSLDLRGVPGFEGAYIVNSVAWDLTKSTGIATITASSAIDPRAESGQGSETTERGVGKHKPLVDAAIRAGFKGAALVTAVAVALAESGGNAGAINRANRNGSIDYGAWQINSVHIPPYDAKLLLDLYYNAKAAWAISKQGTDWSPWTTFRARKHEPHIATARASIETSQTLAFSGPGNGTGGVKGSAYPSYNIESPAQRGWGPGERSQSSMQLIHVGVTKAYVHPVAAPLYKELIRLLMAAGHSHLISGGGWNYRLKRGGSSLSNHSWGLALDMDVPHNPFQRGGPTDMPTGRPGGNPAQARAIAHSLGMRWGGDYRGTRDAMHFEVMLSKADTIALVQKRGLR